MNKLKVNLRNCYGIHSFDYEFDFSVTTTSKPKAKAYAVYAPNGLMKTSFSRTFGDLSDGKNPREERYNRPSTHEVECDGITISKEVIYVLNAEIDISTDSSAITDILVNPQNKARYDEILIDLDGLKNKLIGYLQKSSKIKKIDIEESILADYDARDFPSCIANIRKNLIEDDLGLYQYATIFDSKAIEVLKSQEFVTKASEFSKRYQELFNQSDTIYKKGVFNPIKAETTFEALDKHGFFAGGIVFT